MSRPVVTQQMHQWLDKIQEALEVIERDVAQMESLDDLDIPGLRQRISQQYHLLQVLQDVAQGRKFLVGIRSK